DQRTTADRLEVQAATDVHLAHAERVEVDVGEYLSGGGDVHHVTRVVGDLVEHVGAGPVGGAGPVAAAVADPVKRVGGNRPGPDRAHAQRDHRRDRNTLLQIHHGC